MYKYKPFCLDLPNQNTIQNYYDHIQVTKPQIENMKRYSIWMSEYNQAKNDWIDRLNLN